MELVIVERIYDQPFTDEDAASMVRRFAPCLSVRRIRRLHTYMSKDRQRAICVYEAPDASSVRDVHDREGVAYVRIWSADMMGSASAVAELAAAAGPSADPPESGKGSAR